MESRDFMYIWPAARLPHREYLGEAVYVAPLINRLIMAALCYAGLSPVYTFARLNSAPRWINAWAEHW